MLIILTFNLFKTYFLNNYELHFGNTSSIYWSQMNNQETEDQLISEESADLFIQHEYERLAEEHGVSVDYYISEFT